MAMFRAVATEQLKMVCAFFLLGYVYRLPWANPARACERDLYLSNAVAQYFLFLATLPAVMLLLAVGMDVNIAEAGSLGPGADADAKAAAAAKGVALVAAGWRRAALRGKLLLAVGLSAAASFLAIVAFEDGYRYRRGCADGPLPRSLTAVVLMVFTALLHGFFAWVAVCKD